MKLLDGKVALVTGAGNPDGIGFGACRSLAEAGADVVVTDLVRDQSDQEQLDSRVEELRGLGSDAIGYGLDVSDSREAGTVVEKISERLGRLDIVFNNAGYPGGVGPFLEMTDEQLHLSWQINLMGIVRVCREVVPLMQNQGGGSIVNNSSLAGLGGVAGMSGYCASKFAVIGLTKSLAAEFGKFPIRVNAVCPGMIWTQMGRAEVEFLQHSGQSFEEAREMAVADVPLQNRWADPREVGDAVVYLGSDLASYVTGIALPVAGGLSPGV